MDRRQFLKACASLPLFTLAQSGLAQEPHESLTTPCCDSGSMYIFVHGLIFMEFQPNCLVLTAPQVHNHAYLAGAPAVATPGDSGQCTWIAAPPGKFSRLPHKSDWSQAGYLVPEKNKPDFPPQIMRFSKAQTSVGDLAGPYAFRLVLPFPKNIGVTGMLDRRSFDPNPKSNVGLSISDHRPKVGPICTIIYLEYRRPQDPAQLPFGTQGNKLHLYAESPDPQPQQHMNNALKESRMLFQHSESFDLQWIFGSLDREKPGPSDPACFTKYDLMSLVQLFLRGGKNGAPLECTPPLAVIP
ncbi:MAG TPA: hypothetical protein VKZ53_30025 [Candidatus Angelobacter sp.]|nr:hypothetical protein [Candidatus Angelobacter sp.]